MNVRESIIFQDPSQSINLSARGRGGHEEREHTAQNIQMCRSIYRGIGVNTDVYIQIYGSIYRCREVYTDG
jgi:hypothetical protein